METEKISEPLQGIPGLRAHWKEDLKAGFNISLIALPLCLGIALASGFPPIAGLFAAIVGGLLVSRTNGSFVTITGPAAGLIVVNLAAVESLGEGDKIAGYHYALAAIVVAGVFITLFGFLKAGKLGDFFPTSAVHGMLAAIGVIIMVKQFFVAVAVRVHGHEFYEIVEEIPMALAHANPEVLIISVVSLLILIFYPKTNSKLIKAIPAPVWVLLVAIPLELIMDFEHEHELLFLGSEHKVGPQLLVHLPSNVLDGIALPDFGKIATSAFWISVTTIALVTSIESLLSALAVDSLDLFKRKTNLDKDLKAMGAGASVSGLIGGLPMISEIVRSSANVSNGAKTQWSNFFHGVFLLLFLVIGGPVIEHIPLAALAAMLIFTGYRLASPKEFKHVYQIGVSELIIFVVTLLMVLITDLLIGIAAGIVVNMIINVAKGTSLAQLFKIKASVKTAGTTAHICPEGSIVFSNYLGLKKKILQHADKNILLDLSQVKMLDHTVVHHLQNLKQDFEVNQLKFELANDAHLNPASEHPLAERRANLGKLRISFSSRDKVLSKLAAEKQWQYNAGSTGETAKWSVFSILSGYKVIREHNILTKNQRGISLTLADVELSPTKDLNADLFEFTALHVANAGFIPDFLMEKEQMLDKLMEKMGAQDIDFHTHPRFSTTYKLTGQNEDEIRAFFTHDILTFLEENPGYHLEAEKGSLFVCFDKRVLSKDEIRSLIDFTDLFLFHTAKSEKSRMAN